jgi:nucleoside-diphosphate-sugar epimerase
VVGADDSVLIYKREPPPPGDVVVMGSGGALVSIDKLRRVLGFEPPVSRARALELTLAWAQHARIISGSR